MLSKIGYSLFRALVVLITKGDHRCEHCLNFASFELLFELKPCMIYIYLRVRYSVSKSYFTIIEFQNVNKAFVYINDCNHSLNICKVNN